MFYYLASSPQAPRMMKRQNTTRPAKLSNIRNSNHIQDSTVSIPNNTSASTVSTDSQSLPTENGSCNQYVISAWIAGCIALLCFIICIWLLLL